MSKIVFVLGAGASEHCGTPLMGNFLEVAEDLWRSGELGEVEEAIEHFARVFDAIGRLQGIHSKAKLDTYNVETIYAAFEMGKLLNSLPGFDEISEILSKETSTLAEELISSIKKVIGYTLEKTTKLPHEEGNLQAPRDYDEFINVLHGLLVREKSFSVMTFNYDLGLDYALYKRSILIDYGLGDIDPAHKRHATYLKLHGSLNWGRCKECEKITPYRQFQITEYKAGRDYSLLPVIAKLKKQKCVFCGKPLEEDPFIVPPTWNKTAYHTEIDQVWKRAALELKDAENIFVLGYSLPPTDLFFNYLFALGVDMKTILRGFYVYNPDPEVEKRFRNLLGSGIEQRFHFYNCSFESALSTSWKPTYPLGFKTIPMILDIK